MEFLLKKFDEHCVDKEFVIIAHGDCPEDAKALEAALKQRGVKNTQIGYVGGVIGAHTGPGVLVIFFMGDKR